MSPKTEQLQIRVSPRQKLAIKQLAERAQITVSEWILKQVLPTLQETFHRLVEELATSDQPSFAMAELLDLFDPMSTDEYEIAVCEPPRVPLDPYWQNYLAATVEQAAAAKDAKVPNWTREIAPLREPVFAASLKSLRLHLLIASPPAFARRNIFIDSNLGARV